MEYFHLFTIAGIPITPVKIVTALLLMLAAIQWAFEGRWIRSDRKNPWVLLFFFSYGVALLMTIAKGVSPRGLAWFMTTGLALFIYYFLIPYFIDRRRDLDVLLVSLGTGCLVAVVTGLMGIGDVEETDAGTRIGGLGGEVNLAGFNLSGVLPMMVLFLFVARSRIRRLTAAGVALLAVIGIIMSLSRSAIVATAAMVGLWSVRFRRIDTLIYVIPVFLLLGLVVLLAPERFRERIESFTTEEGRAEDLSIQKRFLVNEYAVRAFASNPLVGVGMGAFGAWANAREPRIGYNFSIHNAYLQVAAGQGLLGLIPYMMILTLTWRDYTRTWKVAGRAPYRSDPEMVRLGLTAIFLQISFLGILVGHVFMPSVRWKMAWLLVAVSNVVIRLASQRITEMESEATEPPSADPVLPPLDATGFAQPVSPKPM
jgi:O-antigen ligase